MYALPYLELTRDELGLLTVPQGDERGAASAIIKLLNDEEYRNAKGLEARLSVETFYDSVDVGEEWQQIFSFLGAGEFKNGETELYDADYKIIIDMVLLHYKKGVIYSEQKLENMRVEKDMFAGEKAVVTSERNRLLSEKEWLVAEMERLVPEKEWFVADRERLTNENIGLNNEINVLNEEKQIILDVGLLGGLPSFSLKPVAEFLSTFGRVSRNTRIQRLGLRLFQFISLEK